MVNVIALLSWETGKQGSNLVWQVDPASAVDIGATWMLQKSLNQVAYR